ncbi:MAG: hypothetical protein QXJ75_02705 [Candidatus Bathyarchaeia archaeon]
MPVFKITAETVAEAWEKSVIKVWEKGVRKLTQYTLPKGGRLVNQESKSATALIIVKTPLKEPRIHAGDVMGQQAIMGGYVEEVVEGTRDNLILEGKWDYTYHERIFSYKVPTLAAENQIERIVEAMSRGGLFSRRLQAVTWQVWKDLKSENPPCFQRLWITVPTLDPEPQPGTTYRLNFQSCWRSRDLFDAWGANTNAIIELCRRKIVAPLNEAFKQQGIKFEIGQYVDFSNDLHIYEKDYGEVENFLLTLKRKRKLVKSPTQVRRGLAYETLVRLGESKRYETGVG